MSKRDTCVTSLCSDWSEKEKHKLSFSSLSLSISLYSLAYSRVKQNTKKKKQTLLDRSSNVSSMRNEHSCCRWNNPNRYDIVFYLQTHTHTQSAWFFFSLSVSLSQTLDIRVMLSRFTDEVWTLDSLIRMILLSLSLVLINALLIFS